MKLGLAAFSAMMGVASAGGTKGYQKLTVENFNADSKAAQKLIDSSLEGRKLEDGWNFDEAFVASHSIIYEGCYTEMGWTDDGYMSQTLVHFTLCPTDSCSSSGCSSSYYGEYIVDLPTFLDSYLESKLEDVRYKCETMREVCGCDGDNNACLYYCYKDFDDDTFDWKFCNDEQGEEERYGECQELGNLVQQDENDRELTQRMAEYNLYVGPTCSSDGKSIYLSVFRDDECQYEHSSGASVFTVITGEELPYSNTSLLETECVSCLEPVRDEDKNDDDYEDEDEVTRFCEESYNSAARCETNLQNYYKDETGCSIISSLQSGQYSGWNAYQLTFSGANTFYAAFLGGVVAVFAVGAYIYVKKKKSGINENEQELVKESQYTLS